VFDRQQAFLEVVTVKHSSSILLGSIGAGCAILLAGCGTAQNETALPGEVTTAIEQALNKNDVAGCVAVFTDDAEVMSEAAPAVRGPQGIRDFCATQVTRELSFDTNSVLSIASGDLAIEQGTYRIRNVELGADVEHGEYLNVWRRNDGRWRIFRSMYNVEEAAKAAVSVSEDAGDAQAPQP
jgi:ketosteroid isomerase-like protein